MRKSGGNYIEAALDVLAMLCSFLLFIADTSAIYTVKLKT
jgi:hypothetical protein